MAVNTQTPGAATGLRAFECAIIVITSLLAADAVRSDLGPLLQTLRLLFGL
jgi:hypothetical protein